jgi:DNA-directed RNA polymerase subunit RPC12/RpoP
MSIEFHCHHCGRPVRAPNDAGGRHAACPSCHQQVYIPTAAEQIEPLGLAPIDEEAERKAQQLERETKELTHRILFDREGLGREGVLGKTGGGASAAPPPPRALVTSTAMNAMVIDYVAAMAAGELDKAARLGGEIRQNPKLADEAVQRLLSDDMPPQKLTGIPRPVLVKFLKQALTE